MQDFNLRPPKAPDRDGFIPIRKHDMVEALVAQGVAGDAEDFRQFCHGLGAIFHYSYFERLEKLRHDYFYFNPEFAPPATLDRAAIDRCYADLCSALTAVMKGANFVEVPHEEIARAHRESAEFHVTLEAALDDFREVRFFRRGHRHREVSLPDWLGLRKTLRLVDVYDDVVLFVAMKDEAAIGSARERKRLARQKIRPGCILIKYFRNIASADLNALYPNARVVLSMKDKLMLGIPAIAGGIPVVLKLGSSVTILLLVAGFYLGLVGTIEEDHLKTSIAAASGLVALGGFLLQQWIKYQRQSLKHQKQLADNVYFRNINNNAGIFDYLIGAAEDQDGKEAILAYSFLVREPLTQDALERRIEKWLLDTFGFDVEFEVDDALAKLQSFGLLQRTSDTLAVPPIQDAVARLDRVWDGLFDAQRAATANACSAAS